MNFISTIRRSRATLSQLAATVLYLAFALAVLTPRAQGQNDIPIITKVEASIPGYPASVRITFVHCSDTNYEYSILSSSNLVNWLSSNTYPAATSNDTLQIMRPLNFPASKATFYRILKTPRIPIPVFPMALIARDTIDLNGNEVRFDSFNSSDTNLSTGGLYDTSKFSDHGDVGVNPHLINAFDIGNAKVYGKIHSGVGSVETTLTIGANASVGDSAWHQTNDYSGIKPGFWLTDMNLAFPSVAVPPAGGFPPVGGSYQGMPYSYLLSTSGGKYVSTVALSGKMMVTGTNVVLWAKSGLNFSGNTDGIFLAPGASLTVYVGNTNSTATCDITGGGGFNTNGMARNFQLYGLPSLTLIKMSGYTPFIGTIYAPNAFLTASGGGSNPVNISGALIVKSATVTGHFTFHFDEDLIANGPFR